MPWPASGWRAVSERVFPWCGWAQPARSSGRLAPSPPRRQRAHWGHRGVSTPASAGHRRPPAFGLLVSPESRQVRRGLGATAWAVLEDVALDACRHGQELVAATNVRRIAANLGISKDTAARALRRLAEAGLLERQSHRGDTGEFAASAYVMHLSGRTGISRLGGDPWRAHPCPIDADSVACGLPHDSRGGGGSGHSRRRSPRTSIRQPSGTIEQPALFDSDRRVEDR